MYRLALLSLLAACTRDVVKPGDTGDTGVPSETGLGGGEEEDGDGYSVSEGDCDDSNADVSPGATEICDGIDNDCDDAIDEDVEGVFYADVDGDGVGDGAAPTFACEAPAGFVENPDDCDDADATAYPGAAEVCDGIDNDCDGTSDEELGATYWSDADGDGYGDADAPLFACEPPAGSATNNEDCDDAEAAIHPGAEEADCLDPVDYNCDGAVGFVDGDGDGWAACEECDDASRDVSPDGVEACNAVDDDCDGDVDEAGATGELTWYADTDGDTYGDAASTSLACDQPSGWVADATDCDDTLATTNPGATETCDGLDEDCDGTADDGVGTVWYTDADGDGYGDPDAITVACDMPAGTVSDATDCDDTTAATSPAASETCNDTDDDCDDSVDEGAIDEADWYYDADGDGYGNPAASTSACDQPAGYTADASDCNDGTALASPAGTETCDGLDNDCDGTADEDGATLWYADADGDGYGDIGSSTASCTAPAGYVATYSDCDDTVASTSPAAPETCDGIDNDCDGSIDETGSLSFFADADGDGYGDPAVVVGGCSAPSGYVANDDDCDDLLSDVNPLGTETCDGVDEDCDGTADDGAGSTWYYDGDGDGYGATSPTSIACTQPAGYADNDDDCLDSSSSYSPAAAEVCDDGLDQDCDGTADDDCPDTVTHCGTISSDETWDGEDIHVVTCDVYVQAASSPLLTIEDGATVEFYPGANLYVGWSSYGELWVDGHTDGVLFTSSDSRPGAGDWDGINFGAYDRGSWLEGATIEYGGGNGFGNVYLVNSSSTLTLLNSVVTDSSNSGVYVTNATIEVSGSTVSDNTDYGIYLSTTGELATTGGATFTGNTLSGNALYPLTVPAAYVGEIDATNAFTGNTSDAVYVYTGTVSSTTTWYGLDVPYYIAGDVTFGAAGGMVMTIADGAELQFASGAALNIGTSNYVDFVVDGTTTGVTFTSSRSAPRAGDWDGLYFGDNVQLATIEGATIGYGGANGYGNVYAYANDADVEITDSVIHDSSNSGVYLSWYASASIHDSTIEDNADYGVYVFDYATFDGDLSFTGNTVTGNDVGLSIPAQEAGALGDDGAYSGNITDDVALRDDTIATDVTLRALDTHWNVTGDITVGGTAHPTLTIEDGAELRFDTGAGLYIGSGNYGSLDVQGSTNGVVFTSSASVPAAGDWDGIQFTWYSEDSYLRGCEIAYGGANGYANLYLSPAGYFGGGATVVEDCVIRDSSNSGIYASTTDEIAVSDTTIQDNADYGFYLDSNSALETTGEPTFTGNTVTGNGLYPLYLPATSLDQLDDGSTYTGNGTDRIYVSSDTITQSGTWQDLDVPFYMNGDTAIYASTTPVITIEAGATFLFNYYASLQVGTFSYGELVVNGTAAEPVVFTSAQSVPAAGDWDGLYFNTYDAGSSLDYVEVSYGGSTYGNIYTYGNGSRVSVSDATVSYSGAYGIYRAGSSTPVLTSITYTGNTSGTLY